MTHLTVEQAREWLEEGKRKNAPPAIRFYAMQSVGAAIERERREQVGGSADEDGER